LTHNILGADSAALFKISNRTALEKRTHLYDDTQGTIKINKIINEKKNEKRNHGGNSVALLKCKNK